MIINMLKLMYLSKIKGNNRIFESEQRVKIKLNSGKLLKNEMYVEKYPKNSWLT